MLKFQDFVKTLLILEQDEQQTSINIEEEIAKNKDAFWEMLQDLWLSNPKELYKKIIEYASSDQVNPNIYKKFLGNIQDNKPVKGLGDFVNKTMPPQSLPYNVLQVED